jgi:hypothetical protein
MQEVAARVNQTATSVAGTSQALRDEVKVLSDRIDAFMTGFRSLDK